LCGDAIHFRSHGVADSGSDLRGWVQLLECIAARVHLARLLGLSNSDAVT
jgi:hypothetical protein